MKKLVILQTVVPDYRKMLFGQIKAKLNKDFELYAGNYYFEESVKTDSTNTLVKKVANYYFINRRILIQGGMWRPALTTPVLVMELNPRILSNWILLIIRWFLNRETVLWGHAWPRNGKDNGSDVIRQMMRNLANRIIVYTETQKKELSKKMPQKIILAAPNSVFHASEINVLPLLENHMDLIFVGRLTKAKKALFLVQAFASILDVLPSNCNLIIVGDGEEKKSIIELVTKNNIENRVYVLGHIGDYEQLKKLYSKAVFSISPGYVGLSITQSFGFGVPMIISRTENHSPEIEMAVEGENCTYFESNDITSLCNQMESIFEKRDYWVSKRASISNSCKKNYSIEAMAAKFIELV